MMRRLIALSALLLPLAACGGDDSLVAAPSAKALRAQSWQENIQERDRKRLAGLWSAWNRSLNEAAKAGDGAKVAALGDMAVPDAARAAPPPVPGSYRCRTIKLGVRDDGTKRADAPAMDIAAFAPCTITARAGLLWFEQEAGAQRIAGTLYPDDDRLVFLGSKALAGEMGVMAYGADASRDQVGVLRAYADGRWRLELPWPMWQSNLEIVEIVTG
ncbi:MAG: DUF4893 domain-containing protein [Polymorphobacter sp.]